MLSKIFHHAVTHAVWMVPMALVMMPTPALASGFIGGLDMMLTNGFNFFADGTASQLIENTLNGVFWDPDYSIFDGSMGMEGHVDGAVTGADHAGHGGGDVVAGLEGDPHAGHGHLPGISEPEISPEIDGLLGSGSFEPEQPFVGM